MSISSRVNSESDSSRLELPVFVSPPELIFATNKRLSTLTVFNPYNNEAQFRIMTTSPERFDVSVTKGIIKPSRRIDITIRLIGQKLDELPEPDDELETIDYFRITVQIGQLKGNRPVKVLWCKSSDAIDTDTSHIPVITGDERSSKLRIRSSKSQPSSSSSHSSLQSNSLNRSSLSAQKSSITRSGRVTINNQVDHVQAGSNVNLDSELCNKVKSTQDQTQAQSTGLLSQLAALLSVSYEMKLGCSFALGLFTYRLISTLPD